MVAPKPGTVAEVASAPDAWSIVSLTKGSGDKVKVVVEEMDEISEESFVFELIVYKPVDAFLRATILGTDGSYYGQVNTGMFCAKALGIPESGISDVEHYDFFDVLRSDEIMIESDWQWVKRLAEERGIIQIQLDIGAVGTPPCTGFPPGGSSDDGPASEVESELHLEVAYPIPESDKDKKKLRKKKICVIWKLFS